MIIYHAWCNLRSDARDMEFTKAAGEYFAYLRDKGLIEGYRITRRQLGLGPPGLPEFHLMVEVGSLSQLDELFTHVSSRADTVEKLHHGVNSRVKDAIFALYRDFPDAHRVSGKELF
ncbi:MAG: DUF6614 family protein [Alphaproteobacteria bacterium]